MRLSLVLACVLCSSPAWGAQVNVTDQTLVSLSTGYGAEGFYVSTQGSLPAGADCGAGNRFVLVPGHSMKSEIVALLMNAMQSRSKVHIFVDGCVSDSMKLQAVALDSQR